MDPIFSIIGCLLYSDLKKYSYALLSLVRNNSFLAIDDAGSIGQARTRVILVRRWKFFYVVDISENNKDTWEFVDGRM